MTDAQAGTPLTDKFANDLLAEGLVGSLKFSDQAEINRRTFAFARSLERTVAELAAFKENTIGVLAAWKRDYEAEKERGDKWMADCKSAEQRAMAARRDAFNEVLEAISGGLADASDVRHWIDSAIGGRERG